MPRTVPAGEPTERLHTQLERVTVDAEGRRHRSIGRDLRVLTRIADVISSTVISRAAA